MKRLAPPTAAPEGNGRTAFVLSGGGSLGAVQVGMLQALTEAGIRPDLLIGTSVGAVNAAWIGGKPDHEGALVLGEVWRGPRRQDIFPLRPRARPPGLFGPLHPLIPHPGLGVVLRKPPPHPRPPHPAPPVPPPAHRPQS